MECDVIVGEDFDELFKLGFLMIKLFYKCNISNNLINYKYVIVIDISKEMLIIISFDNF